MRVTILGAGSSGGTPLIGVGWGDCDPENPKNRRTRPSILIERDETVILVDTSPDLREQLLRADVQRLDAVLYTHAHADHLHGIDDLRAINRAYSTDIPIYLDAPTLREIETRFGYVLAPLPDGTDFYFKPVLVPNLIRAGDTFAVNGIEITCFDQDHGAAGRTLGFRTGGFAYTTDAVELPDEAFEVLSGLDTWVVGALGGAEHPTHAHVDKAVGCIERAGARRGVISHMSHRLDYAKLAASLPPNIEPAYDGMVLEIG